ncbi:MAG: HD domain-containing protein [Sporomusaceae bacterium]|nr:HD domain-containing protein [Sporomusaceae bacterium]
MVGDYFTGMYWINQYNWQDSIKVAGPPLTVNNYCLGVSKGNPSLVLALNNAISTIKTTGQLQQLQDKWFGENYFSSNFIHSQRFLELLRWFVVAVVFIISIGLLFVYSLRRKVHVATSRLREANHQLANAYEVTIRAFFSALEKRESGTARHSLIVNSIALEIGKEMNLSEMELLYLNWGTLLHDIGKLAISDDILLKQGKLTEAEYEKIKCHPQIGYEILQDAEYLKEAAQIALYHQERYDGKGYPYGLIGDQIPLLARICTVADAFEAMIADRPYHKGRCCQEALAEVVKHSGSQFDPAVVEIFIKLDHSKFLDANKE